MARIVLCVCWSLALTVWAGSDEIFQGGLWRTFTYEKPSVDPIVFSGESRCEAVNARDYCLYLDIWHDDGSTAWAIRAPFNQGSHGWEKACGAFVPARPVKEIKMYAFLRHGTGRAVFRHLALARRDPPYTRERPLPPSDGFVVWTADSMRRVTPRTFPSESDKTSSPSVCVSLARRERESFQVLVSTSAGTAWTEAEVKVPELRNQAGKPLRGHVTWHRIGYVRRPLGRYLHPFGAPPDEDWLPDPLLPPAPFAVRKGTTQGLWLTVYAAPDAEAGDYSGDLVLTERGEERACVRVTAKVEAFSLPAVFGMKTSFSVMDGFTRSQYPASYQTRKRESWDLMLDHRLNPDDISRTTPPDLEDLLYARSRGMNLFNILNIVPEPEDKNRKWVCFSPPEATEDPAFYPVFKARLEPYVASLKRHGLDRLAYLYGFDERERRYYPGIDAIWKKLKNDFPGIPVMTTAMMYRDYAAGETQDPLLLTTDWHCPLTDVYNREVSQMMRARGKEVWWYVACGPTYPYANIASLEFPPVEGRLLGWMTHLYRADGLLYWHVNFWNGPCVDEKDPYFSTWNMRNGLFVPRDGVLLYPGKNGIMPSIRLAQIRDGVEDYEWLQLAAAKVGRSAVDAESRRLIRTLTDFTRDPATIRAVRARLAAFLTKEPSI